MGDPPADEDEEAESARARSEGESESDEDLFDEEARDDEDTDVDSDDEVVLEAPPRRPARAAPHRTRRQALLGLLHRGSGSLDLVGVAAPGSAARPAKGSAATASLRGVGKVQISPCDEDQPVATPHSNP